MAAEVLEVNKVSEDLLETLEQRAPMVDRDLMDHGVLQVNKEAKASLVSRVLLVQLDPVAQLAFVASKEQKVELVQLEKPDDKDLVDHQDQQE